MGKELSNMDVQADMPANQEVEQATTDVEQVAVAEGQEELLGSAIHFSVLSITGGDYLHRSDVL